MRGPFPLLGAVFAGLAVAAGAFAAHALKGVLVPDLLAAFETGVRYQVYHALALLLIGWIDDHGETAWARRAGWLFVAGIVLFSGSLYVLSLSGIRWVGAVTPLGGLALTGGWICLAVACLPRRQGP